MTTINTLSKKLIALLLALCCIPILQLAAPTKEIQANASDSRGYNTFSNWNSFVNSYTRNALGYNITNKQSKRFDMPSDFYIKRGPLYPFEIPNEMNCTLISIQNLLNRYRYAKKGINTQTNLAKYVTYSRIEQIARNNYNYSSSSGLAVWNHKGACTSAFNSLGFSNTNVNTFSKLDSTFTTNDLCRNEPYILSSTTTYHSIYVYGWTKATLNLDTPSGVASRTIILLNAFDPNGDHVLIDGNNIIKNSASDMEQVMYIKSCS